MKIKYRLFFFVNIFLLWNHLCVGQENPSVFRNPILAGFSPDPSICRVGDDYYLVSSSFVWYPAIPIYHSKDLVNWKLIGHGISDPGKLKLNGLKDKNGIWAVTIRHHDGLFYLITNCNECGGNFYVTAKDPRGPWSDPVWLKDAPGIDPSLFWEDDGKCYYTGNYWDFKKSWPGQVAVWMQELDLNQQKLVGERKQLTYGHANNATYAESPHVYKVDGKYLLMIAEGGTDLYHAITVHQSKTLFGPYTADKINPVLSHRHLGAKYPLQAIGHGDLVQTQNGEWWAVVLGKRLIDGNFPLSRETFLCKVEFENGTPIFNPGYGIVLSEQKRPDLPWSPVKPPLLRDNFDETKLDLKWHFVRVPTKERFYNLNKSQLELLLKPESADSLVCAPLLLQKIQHARFEASTKLNFKTKKENEEAGLMVHRGNESYYLISKTKSGLVLTRKFNGKKEVLARVNYQKPLVYLKVQANNMKVIFSFGDSENNMQTIGGEQSLVVIAESSINRFNGPGIGMYASSNGRKSTGRAYFDWFDYKPED